MAASLVAMSSTIGIGPVARHRDCNRIVADHALGAAGRRHQRPRVAHDDADAVGLRGLDRIAPRRPEMEAVAHRDDAGPVTLRALDRNLDGLLASQLPERMAGIEHDRRVLVRNDNRFLLGRNRAIADAIEIHVHQHDAVRRNAVEVGVDQRIGDDPCGAFWNSRCHEQTRHQGGSVDRPAR